MMFGIVSIALILLTFLYTLLRYKEWRQKFSALDEVPGPRNYPLIGNFWTLALVPRADRMKYAASLQKKYGKLYKMWMGSQPVLFCSNAEDAQTVLNNPSSSVNKDLPEIDFMKCWLGESLLTSNGPEWHQRRKVLTPTFYYTMLESFLPTFAQHSKTFVESLRFMVNDKEERNIYLFLRKCTFDIICDTAMGVTFDFKDSKTPAYFENLLKINNIIVQKVFLPWWHNKTIYSYSSLYQEEARALNVLHSMSKNVIQRNRDRRQQEKYNRTVIKTNEDDEKEKKAFLDLLLDLHEDNQVYLTDDDIRGEVDSFLSAGHGTATAGIMAAIHFLSTHPDVQDKVAEELYAVFGDSDRNPTFQDLSELKYLDCVLKESLRILAPVQFMSRQISEPLTLGGKHKIPAGTMIRLQIAAIQHQEKYFPDPLKFNPDNFSPENSRKRHPCAFLAFGFGPRNCLGQKFAMLEEKIIVSTLFRNYELRSTQKLEDLGLVPRLVLYFDNGVRVSLRPREWKTADKF